MAAAVGAGRGSATIGRGGMGRLAAGSSRPCAVPLHPRDKTRARPRRDDRPPITEVLSTVSDAVLTAIVVFSFAFVGAWLVGQLLVKRPGR